jgi:hypothetical protein
VRWAKNKKHKIGLGVGSLVLSIFRFSVLSQWFTFIFYVCRFCFLHLAVTLAVWQVRDFGAFHFQVARKIMRAKNFQIPLNPLFAILRVTNWPFLFFVLLSVKYNQSFQSKY